jgi:hypothetical protein
MAMALGRMRSTSQPFEERDPTIVPLTFNQTGLRLSMGVDAAYFRLHLSLHGWLMRQWGGTVGAASPSSYTGSPPRSSRPVWRRLGELEEPMVLPGLQLGLGVPLLQLLVITGDGSFINGYNLELSAAWRNADLPMDATWSARVGWGLPDWSMLSTTLRQGFGTAVVTHRIAEIDVRVSAALGGTAWRAEVSAEVPVGLLGF